MKIRTRRDFRQGHTITEAAFVLSIALTLTMAIYDYSRYFMLSQLVNNAAREGARYAVANTNLQSTSTVQSTVIQYLGNQTTQIHDSAGNNISASDVSVTQVGSSSPWYDATFGTLIQVQVNAKFTPLFPSFGFMPSTVNITGTATMQSEAN